MIGAIPAGLAQALIQPQQQPFTWGAGGKRMTPEEIARLRQMGAQRMQSDYSPVQHWTQGLGRVADNLLGALDMRDADKASDANRQYSDKVLEALMNPGGPTADPASPGTASSTMPGGNMGLLSRVMADPYVSPQVRDMAVRQMEMADFERKERLRSQYGEQPEIVRLAQVANDPMRSADERAAAAGRIKALNDPEIVIPGLPSGTYVGPRSGVGMAFGQAPADTPDELPSDFFDEDPPPVSAAPAAPNAITRAQYNAIVQEYGKAETDRLLSSSNIQVR